MTSGVKCYWRRSSPAQGGWTALSADRSPRSRCGSAVVVVMVGLWLISSTLWSVASPTCQFPAFLLTNASDGGQVRDWRGGVREQHMDSGLDVTVSWGTMTVRSSDDKVPSYVLHCVEMLHANDKNSPSVKFLVERVDGGGSSYYTCVQFVRRSPAVFQLRKTPLSDPKPDVAICHAALDMWYLEPWIVVDRIALGSGEGVPCALRGGFGVRMYDRAGQQGACDPRRGESRIEADCEQLGGGMYFQFRHTSCIPVGLYMYATQRTLCVANWVVGAYTFTLLQHDQLAYSWLLRFPTKPEDSFTAYLLADLVADAIEYLTETSNYIRLDMVKDVPRPATSLCLDEHDDACAAWRRPCTSGAQMALQCARTCGICNATRPVVCLFPPDLVGSWQADDAGLTVQFQRSTLTMSPVLGSRLSTLKCVRWQHPPVKSPTSERFRYMSDEMLVAEYGDGCLSRYVCARILRKSSSVMYFRLSAARLWPLTASPAEPIDCHSFSFDHADTAQENVDLDAVGELQANHFRLLFSRESRGSAVSCRLPEHELNNYSVTFRDGVECMGSVFEEDSATSLRLTLTSCASIVNRTQYSFHCRETSRLPPANDLVVIVSSTPTGNRTVYHCWLFPVAVGVFYLFEAGQCDAVMRGIKPTVSATGDPLPPAVDPVLTPLAVFSSKSRRSPREEDDPDAVVSPASRVHHADVRRRVMGAYINASLPSPPSSSSTSSVGGSAASLVSTLFSHFTIVALTASVATDQRFAISRSFT